MTVEIKVPSVGESITEVTIESWLKKEGESIERDNAVERQRVEIRVVRCEAVGVRVVVDRTNRLDVRAQGRIGEAGFRTGRVRPPAAAVDKYGERAADDDQLPAPPASHCRAL